MPWMEKDQTGGIALIDGQDKEQLVSSLGAPLQKETGSNKEFYTVDFQPVKSPGNYEAEFALKESDIIFHFWPWGYHEADSKGTATPHFKRGAQNFLVTAMAATFTAKRIQIEEDKDMGAIFVRAMGFGSNQFWKKLAIDACEAFHKQFET